MPYFDNHHPIPENALIWEFDKGSLVAVSKGGQRFSMRLWPAPYSSVLYGAADVTPAIPIFHDILQRHTSDRAMTSTGHFQFSLVVNDLFSFGPSFISGAELGKALDSIPEPVRAYVLNMSAHPDEDVRNPLTWNLLNLAARHPSIVDIANSNPVLAYCLARQINFDYRVQAYTYTDEEIAALLQKPQHEALAEIGLPGSKAFMRVCRKVKPKCLTRDFVERLRKLNWSRFARKQMAHLPQVNLGVVAALGHYRMRPYMTNALLAEIAGSVGEDYVADTANHLGDCEEHIRHCVRHGEAPMPFRTVAEVRAFHDSQVGLHRQRRLDAREEIGLPDGLPDPPLPDIDGIEAIRSVRDLIQEGEDQCHCVGSYARRVHEGFVYIYRMTSPERATLSIRMSFTGEWTLDQIYAKRNEHVSEAARQHALDWIRTSRPLAKHPTPRKILAKRRSMPAPIR